MEKIDFNFLFFMSERSKVRDEGCAVSVDSVATACLYAWEAMNGLSQKDTER